MGGGGGGGKGGRMESGWEVKVVLVLPVIFITAG